MIYLVLYLVGLIITFGSLLIFEKRLEGEYLVFFLVSLFWPLSIPLKIGYVIYYFVTEKYKKLFPKTTYEDPWETYVNETINTVKPKKKSKAFKFGR